MEKLDTVNSQVPNIIPIATVVNIPANNQTMPIITARPLLNNICQPGILMRCRDCNTNFYARESDKGSCSYYRCKNCRKHFLSRSLISSCIIS